METPYQLISKNKSSTNAQDTLLLIRKFPHFFSVPSIKNFKRLLLFFLSIAFLFFSSQIYAFSLKGITVKSSFGEKFYAEIIVNNDTKKDLKVSIGNAREYALLSAKRPKLVDELIILEPIEFISFNQQLIKIISNKPLFYPSFNLVLKATLDNGIILEKYSLSVDYKKNMSLKLSPSSIKDKSKKNSRATEIHEVMAKKNNMAPKNKNIPGEELLIYTTGPGETLATIIKKTHPQRFYFYRGIVALWKINKNKFSHNNINGLEIGTRLSFANLDEEMGKTTSSDALHIIRKHWKEWQKIKARERQVPESRSIIALPLPGENIASADKILETLFDWQQSWENEDLKKHFSYYSENFLSDNYRKKNVTLAGWKYYKSSMLSQNKIKNIDIKSLHIRKEGNTVIASFLQKFSSDRFTSFGTKTVTFEKKGEQWKINKELFRTEPTEIIYEKHPYVIHSSSHKNRAKAIKAANDLRKYGFSAYIIKSIVPERGKWFRVVIDRFRTKKDATLLAKKLTVSKYSSYAIALKLPYAISLGSYENETEAYKTIQIYRKKLYSPYLFSIGVGKKIIHYILIGGYKNKKEASDVSKKLTKKNITNQVIQP